MPVSPAHYTNHTMLYLNNYIDYKSCKQIVVKQFGVVVIINVPLEIISKR